MNVLIIHSHTIFRAKLRHQDYEVFVVMNHVARHNSCPGVSAPALNNWSTGTKLINRSSQEPASIKIRIVSSFLLTQVQKTLDFVSYPWILLTAFTYGFLL